MKKTIGRMYFAAFVLVMFLNTSEGCDDGWIPCNNGKCIFNQWVCDFADDCGDGSDEELCWSTVEYTIQTSSAIPTSSPTPTSPPSSTFPPAPTFPPLGYEITSISGVEAAKKNLTNYFLNSRQSTRSINKWGSNIMRTAMALFLPDSQFFAPGNITGEEIGYELSMRLMSKLALKKKISTQKLSLFINALTVACISPRDFFGIDLVAELRKRVDNSNYTNPFYILTLCLAKESMNSKDVSKLQQQFNAHLRPLWMDIQATTAMALACVVNQTNLGEQVFLEILSEMVAVLKKGQHKNGTISNLKTTALVVQALLATGSYRTDFDINAAVRYILQEVSHTYASHQELYYILPIFSSKSLVNISSDHCTTPIKTDMDVIDKFREHLDDRIQVQVSIYVGDDMDYIRTWKLKVPSNCSFYQALENIGALEPTYKVQYSVSEGKPYVVGLKNYQDNAEDGLFWFIYIQPLSPDSKPKLTEKSPVEIQVNETEELILWYRSGFWSDSQKNTSNDTSTSDS